MLAPSRVVILPQPRPSRQLRAPPPSATEYLALTPMESVFRFGLHRRYLGQNGAESKQRGVRSAGKLPK